MSEYEKAMSILICLHQTANTIHEYAQGNIDAAIALQELEKTNADSLEFILEDYRMELRKRL